MSNTMHAGSGIQFKMLLKAWPLSERLQDKRGYPYHAKLISYRTSAQKPGTIMN
jgi:hypothetical protein